MRRGLTASAQAAALVTLPSCMIVLDECHPETMVFYILDEVGLK